VSSPSAPVPPPGPASGAPWLRTGRSAATTGDSHSTAERVGTPLATGASPQPAPAGVDGGASGESGGTTGGSGGTTGGSGGTTDGSRRDRAGSGGNEAPPDAHGDPESSALAAASLSVGEGASGAVVGAGLGEKPEADVTVGSNPVVGDAPPSQGTGIGLGGRLLNPPPTIPILPG
jgi:hypothetical protein